MTEAKRKGLLFGALIGDALGAPFNGVKSGHIGQLCDGWVEGYLEDSVLFPDKPLKNVLPGVHTSLGQIFLTLFASQGDDTMGQKPLSQAGSTIRELADEIPNNSKFPTNSLGKLRKVGKSLRTAVEVWNEEYPWEPEDHFSKGQESHGASPCFWSLAAALNPNELNAIEIARMTHLQETVLIGSWIVCRTAEHLMEVDNPKKVPAKEILDVVQSEAVEKENELRDGEVAELWKELGWGYPRKRMSDSIGCLAALLETGEDSLAEKSLINQANEYSPDRGVTHVQHGFAPICVPWVLYRALGPFSHSGGTEDALNRGGETSLVTGMISGLLGARYGFESIREEWVEGLKISPQAKNLFDHISPATTEDWLAAEQNLTVEEENFRRPIHEKREKHLEGAPKPKRKKKQQEPDSIQPQQDTGKLPFAPPPQVWLEEKGDELAPWEKKRLKAERGKKRIGWKEQRRQDQKQVDKDEKKD